MSSPDTPDDAGFLCPASEVTEGVLREITAEGPEGETSLIVTRTDGAVHGWYNICPHAGRSLNFAPDRFLFDASGRLVCAAHGAVFTLPDGCCVDGPCRGAELTPVTLIENDDGIWWRHDRDCARPDLRSR